MKKLKFLLAFLYISLSLVAQSELDSQIEKVHSSLTEGNYKEAMELNQELLKQNKKNRKVNWMMALIPYAQGEYHKSIEYFDEYLKLVKKKETEERVRAYWFKAHALKRIQNVDGCIKNLKLALVIDSSRTAIVADLANVYMDSDDYITAENILDKAVLITKNDPIIWHQYGILYYYTNRIDSAIDAISKAIKLDDKNSDYHYYKGFLLQEKKDEVGALYYFSRAITLSEGRDNSSEKFFMDISESYYGEALKNIGRELNEKDLDKWYEIRALVYSNHGKHPKAQQELTKVINRNLQEDAIYYLYLRGIENQNLGFHHQAIDDFTKCTVYSPNYAYTYGYMGDSYRLLANFEEAINQFSIAIEKSPEEQWFYYRRGWCKEYLKDYKGALEDYNEAIDLDSDYAYTYLNRGRLYEKFLNQKEKAKADYEKILELDTIPLKDGGCRQYALIHLGRKQEAIDWMNRILKLDAKGNYYDAICLYSIMGMHNKAIFYLKCALESGYRNFGHLATDDDLDNIREMIEFKAIIEKWKKIYQEEIPKEEIKEEEAVGYRQLVG